VSWGPNHFDVFGVSVEGEILHQYWDGKQYQLGPGLDDWEELSGVRGLFEPTLVAKTWAAGALDVRTVEKESGELRHAFWRNYYNYQEFQSWDGDFAVAPQVVHWGVNQTDIVRQFVGESQYRYLYQFYKSYEDKWVTSDWQAKGGAFKSQPTLTSWGDNDLNSLGIDETGTLQWQMWDGKCSNLALHILSDTDKMLVAIGCRPLMHTMLLVMRPTLRIPRMPSFKMTVSIGNRSFSMASSRRCELAFGVREREARTV
jgi:hypothetical protein